MAQKQNLQESSSAQEDKNRSTKRHAQRYGAVVTSSIRRYWPGVILILALLVALLLQSRSPEAEPPVQCKTLNEELASEPIEIPSDLEFPFPIGNQVIVTGPKSKIEEMDEVLADLELEPIKTCTLSYSDENQPYLFAGVERGELTMDLYHIPDPTSHPVQDVVKAINEVSQERNWRVFAYPNLLMGSSHSVCGSPDPSAVGSPFGSPMLLPVGEEVAVKLFWEQWAFQQVSVGPSLKNELAGAAILHQGEGTLVAVFDTSPFLDPWDRAARGKRVDTIQTLETLKWVNPTMDVEPLELLVSYPRWATTLDVPVIRTKDGLRPSPDIRDHGLFVAGLVHAVAPASELRLVRVLNEFGCGDLYTFNVGLKRFVDEVKEERETLQGVVINLSLGVPGLTLDGGISLDECAVTFGEAKIVSLCETLIEARNGGAVIVAAAGNGSGEHDSPQPAQIPAAFECVIGVQATNRDGDLACFSNAADYSAPGGDRRGDDGRTDQCVQIDQMRDKDYVQGIIGPVLFPPQGHAYWPTHYAYWSGTSFSAPLVSGLAALALQAGATPPCAVSRPLEYLPLVDEAIGCGADLSPDGVINVPATLYQCLP